MAEMLWLAVIDIIHQQRVDPEELPGAPKGYFVRVRSGPLLSSQGIM